MILVRTKYREIVYLTQKNLALASELSYTKTWFMGGQLLKLRNSKILCVCDQAVSGEIRDDLAKLEAQLEHERLVFDGCFYDYYSNFYASNK